MPLRPVTGTLKMPLCQPDDAVALFKTGLQIVQHSSSTYQRNATRDLADYFFYLGAVHPDWAQPLQKKFVCLCIEELKAFNFGFETWLYLLQGADNDSVEVASRLLCQQPSNYVRQAILVSIGTPAAMESVATIAARYSLTNDFENMGFEIPPNGQAARSRFSLCRRAVKKVTLSDDLTTPNRHPNPIGLPLNQVAVKSSQAAINWHYLSLTLNEMNGLPAWPFKQLHLVGPLLHGDWALYCRVLKNGKYKIHSLITDPSEEYDDADLLRQESTKESVEIGYAELLPYDEKLIYSNGHVLMTPEVYGHAGGPSIGLYPNPKCAQCNRLMFHVVSVEARICGDQDGFRSLFACEDCSLIACNSTWWN
jgi:hypothetical protein